MVRHLDSLNILIFILYFFKKPKLYYICLYIDCIVVSLVGEYFTHT